MKPKVLAIIPARGGSKGVPRKNIRELAGKPLIAWTIEEAKKSKYISKLILSSEDEEIIEVAKKYGCEVPFVRPKELAVDNTPGIDPVLHAISMCPGFEYVVLLQPTSPLRSVEDIDGCIMKILESNAEFCVSVSNADKSPYWMFTLNNEKLVPVIPQEQIISTRQGLPKSYVINGAVYVAKIDSLKKTKSFLTDSTFSYIMLNETSMDIDTMLDFKICEYLLMNQKN